MSGGNDSELGSLVIFVTLVVLTAVCFTVWTIAWVTAAPGRFVMWQIDRALEALER